MEVILLERIETLGQMGQVVKVKPGYARNFLLPQKKALRANKANLEYFESTKVQLEAENLKRRDEAEAVAKTLEGLSVVIIRQAGDSGQLYGSVTGRDLADAAIASGVTVDRKQVELERAIKMLGLHTIKIRLHPEVAVDMTANVARSEAEAASQAKTGHMVSTEEQHDAEEAAVESVIAEVEQAEAAEQAEATEVEESESEAEKPASSHTKS